MIVKEMSELIGKTPMLEIPKEVSKLENITLYVKCEYMNPFGSLKDRAAWWLIKEEIAQLKEEERVVIESSSGNTAKAMAVLCAMNGVKFKTVTNRIKVPEVREVLKVLGAEVEELPGMSECPDPSNPNDPIRMIEERVAREPGKYYHPNQYTNLKNVAAHYETTGPEILADLGRVDFVVSTLGTTGSSGGVVEYLRDQGQKVVSIGVIGKRGESIPGIRNRDEMYEVGIFKKENYEEILEVDSKQAVEGMLILNRKLGVLAGPTSGAALVKSLDYLREIDKEAESGSKAVFIACDRLEWYMSYIKKRNPELFGEEKKTENMYTLSEETMGLSREVELDEVEEMVKKGALLIDLRGNMAYRVGHIEGAVNLADKFLDEMIEHGLPFEKEREIVLICVSGYRAGRYSALLNSRGLKSYAMKGGMSAWQERGGKIVSELHSKE